MSKLFTINKEELKKAGIKFFLVMLGFVATFLESDLLTVINVPIWTLPLIVALNTGLVDLIRKFIKNEEGKYFGGLFKK